MTVLGGVNPAPKTGGSLGEFFASCEFPNEEKDRIAKLIRQSDGAVSRVAKQFIVHTRLYKEGFQKKEKIPGFRPGHELYHKQAIPRIIRELGDNNSQCWELYREAAIDFIGKELPNLDYLLERVSAPPGTTAIADMFKAVCDNASAREVTLEHITTFYEVWGVKRIDNFEESISAWLKAAEFDAQQRRLACVLTELDEFKRALDESSLQVAERIEGLARACEHALADHKELQRAKADLEALTRRVSDLHQTYLALDDAIKGINDQIGGLTTKLDKLARRVEGFPAEPASTKDIRKLADDTRTAISGSVGTTKEAVSTLLKEDFAAATAELEAKFLALSADVDKRTELAGRSGASAASKYRSPLVGPINAIPTTHKLTSEIDFVNSWMHLLSQSHNIVLPIQQAIAYHRAILGSYVVICEREFALSWIDCLAWQPFTMHMAASPTWTTEEDWSQVAEHLFRRDSGRGPRFAVLHNYDVGLVDCYLCPTLVLWALRGESRGLSKIFLIPSSQQLEPISQVLEHAVSFSSNDYSATNSFSLKDDVRTPPPLYREVPRGVDPKVVTQWLQSATPTDEDLTSLEGHIACRMTDDLLANFRRTVALATRYLDEASSRRLAMQQQVVPWVRAQYGDAKAAELLAYLDQLSDDRC